MRKGHDFRDYICPDCFENERDHFRIGGRYGRVLFLKDYGISVHWTREAGASDTEHEEREHNLTVQESFLTGKHRIYESQGP